MLFSAKQECLGRNEHFKIPRVERSGRVFITVSVNVFWKVSLFHQRFKLDYRLKL